MFHGAFLRRQLAQEYAQQGAFADAVVADQSDAIAAPDLQL